jgi:hypothetical protein
MEEKITYLVHLFWNLSVLAFFVFVFLVLLALVGLTIKSAIKWAVGFFEKKRG